MESAALCAGFPRGSEDGEDAGCIWEQYDVKKIVVEIDLHLFLNKCL